MTGAPHDTASGADGVRLVTSSDQREHERSPSMMTAWLRLDGDEEGLQQVRIRNLSDRGLMAEPGYPVMAGTRATLTLPGIGEVMGQVAWSAEGRIGVSLDAEIDPERVRKAIVGK